MSVTACEPVIHTCILLLLLLFCFTAQTKLAKRKKKTVEKRDNKNYLC